MHIGLQNRKDRGQYLGGLPKLQRISIYDHWWKNILDQIFDDVIQQISIESPLKGPNEVFELIEDLSLIIEK